MRVAAHAVDGNDQGGLGCNGNGGAVLIVIPIAQETDVGVFDPQAGDQRFQLDLNAALYHRRNP